MTLCHVFLAAPAGSLTSGRCCAVVGSDSGSCCGGKQPFQPRPLPSSHRLSQEPYRHTGNLKRRKFYRLLLLSIKAFSPNKLNNHKHFILKVSSVNQLHWESSLPLNKSQETNLLPIDSSKENMTVFPVLASSWILFPIHLNPGSVSCWTQADRQSSSSSSQMSIISTEYWSNISW